MRTWRRLLFLCSFSSALVSSTTHAARAADERADLVREIGQDYEALSTSDCTVACRAFASMQRAAARLCEIDPGDACADARAKLEDARRRVQSACPACAVDAKRNVEPPAPTPAPEARALSAPPEERKRGGCAGCNMVERDPRGDALIVLLFTTLGVYRSRRRERMRPH